MADYERTEVRVVREEATGPVVKYPDPHGTKASKWGFDSRYILQDGRTIDMKAEGDGYSTKRAATEAHAKMPLEGFDLGDLHAIFHDDRFVGRRLRITVGGPW